MQTASEPIQPVTAHAGTQKRQELWGIFTREERWGLSSPGKAIIASIMLLTSGLVVFGIQPYLCVTQRVNADVLVVEGWIPRYAIHAGAIEFWRGGYKKIFSTGGPVAGNGGYINDFQTSASVGAERLKKEGITIEALQMVPSHTIGRDRTYFSAVALREWLRSHHVQVGAINVVTEGPHARRTRLLYQKAFGKDVRVGIISVANPDYNPGEWWRYSDGVKDVISEGAAYVYARLFFWTSGTESGDQEQKAITQ
jgi:uncharacterized SAM-binding protein YcdF (DUF218 family)